MGHKTEAMKAIRGIDPGKLPYAPRFDLWFNAHRYRGTLPEEYRGCENQLAISRKMGVGANLVIPDYLNLEDPSMMFDRGIGLQIVPQVPYRYTLKRVERTVEVKGTETYVNYKTPKGTISVSFGFTDDMRHAGSSISRITKYAITDDSDFDKLMFIFDNIEVAPYYDDLEKSIADVGEDALVVGKCSAPAAPMQYIMRDLMGMTPFFFALMDKPDKLRDLTTAISPYFEEIMKAAVSCPADILFYGANTDEVITPPPFYEEHLMPWIKQFADMAHAHGKFTQLHADGENKALFDLYRQSDIDILEAVATAPMTKSGIHEILAKTDGMTIWGGIPSVALMPESFSDDAFAQFMEELLDAVGTGPNFILGVSDTTPPDADFSRLLYVRDLL